MADIVEYQTPVSHPVKSAVATRANRELPATGNTIAEWRRAWQRAIDDQLLRWLEDPGQLEDDGVNAPSSTIIRLSIDYAEQIRDRALPPPGSIVVDGDGGIVFERILPADKTELMHFWNDGTIEVQAFDGDRMIERYAL